jgi:hypothetical protein
VRSPHGQALPVERLDDFGSEDRLELLDVRILVPQIAEYMALQAAEKLEFRIRVSL